VHKPRINRTAARSARVYPRLGWSPGGDLGDAPHCTCLLTASRHLADLCFAWLKRVVLAMEEEQSAGPVYISWLSPSRIAFCPDGGRDLLERARSASACDRRACTLGVDCRFVLGRGDHSRSVFFRAGPAEA